MAYRNGTYIAFHANNTANPSASDMKYYNALRMWRVRKESDFKFVNSHEKRDVRDSSSREALRRGLRERISNSKHLLLIIGETTRFDTDWVPFEIMYAIDYCEIPIIAAYPGYVKILAPEKLSNLWPKALADRINNKTARVIHIPFKKEPIQAAISQFHLNNLPKGSLSHYSKEVYERWGY